MPHVAPRLAVLALLCVLFAAPSVRAEGLRISESLAALNYSPVGGGNVNLMVATTSARVSRGRAALSLNVPLIHSPGEVMVSDEHYVVGSGGSDKPRTGVGDLGVGLEYNLIQNRQKMFILTLGGNARFNTAAAGLGNGEQLLGVGLSAVYGITRQLLAFADARQSWRTFLVPTRSVMRMGELGAIYWISDKLGLSASTYVADYGLADADGKKQPLSVEMNLGVTFEAFPGVMMNAGGIGGLTSSAPNAGGTFGFGFEL